MGGDVVVGGAGVSVVRVSTPDPVGALLLSAIVADLVVEGCLSGAFGLVDFPGDCGVRDSWVLDGSDYGGADWWRERFWDLCEDVERGGVGRVSPECSYGIVVGGLRAGCWVSGWMRCAGLGSVARRLRLMLLSQGAAFGTCLWSPRVFPVGCATGCLGRLSCSPWWTVPLPAVLTRPPAPPTLPF